ncbi:AraC-type DNA-binding protein [Luteibacter sp. UNCMF331Sha3.1]|uniref:AraC family transcriptional regulator n=1 Tax=Luteibacter sp. UNCMF331Sha3.1 TaxID=1502760 RepID=UPI0008BAB297|nr:AraC family transcriptional regulator [Luteibacter sp. UNCMF331Sha3.1]SEM94190.1 AraC-type DNA-binding protein [Luteibacter sp. UNCMF331Sha3.1]
MSNPLLDALSLHTDRRPGDSPYATDVPGLTLLRSDTARMPNLLVYRPVLCVVAQGSKSAVFGDRRVDYAAGESLVVSVEMPALGHVTQASATEPFLGAVLELDPAVLHDVMLSMNPPPEPASDEEPASAKIRTEGPIADCVTRLIRLIDTPAAIAVLQPAIMKELAYWLLVGPQAGVLARLAVSHAQPGRIVGAIRALRDRFAQPVRVDELASIAQLSPSAFHRQFKQVTSMTPLQYQKHLRLFEARRLMLADASSAESAAYAVGYESPSQFSREYARMFGSPPRRDVATLRATASA